MPTAIFVHGTGVREPGFSRLFDVIQRRLAEKRPDFAVVPCYWGETRGARLWHGGDSVPSYDTARSIGALPADEAVALWSLLYQDPLWELRTIASATRVGASCRPAAWPPAMSSTSGSGPCRCLGRWPRRSPPPG